MFIVADLVSLIKCIWIAKKFEDMIDMDMKFFSTGFQNHMYRTLMFAHESETAPNFVLTISHSLFDNMMDCSHFSRFLY